MTAGARPRLREDHMDYENFFKSELDALRGTERLRITPTPLHSEADMDHLVSALSELWSQCALARAVA